MPPLRRHSVRRKATKNLDSSSLNSNGLGTLSRIPYELRQAIFEQLVPPEIPLAATAQSFEMDKESSDKNNPQHAASTPAGLQALLCTSKAIATEVRRSYQNREYQLSLSTSGIIFEGVRSAVEFRCFCHQTWPFKRWCNHCEKGLIWKVATSSQTRPLSRCRALRAFKAIQPRMRRLHVTFTGKPSAERLKRVCLASRIWDRVRKAELAGVEVRFTFQNNSGLEPDWLSKRLFPSVLPAQYAYKVNVI
jgi:hypothetical protein